MDIMIGSEIYWEERFQKKHDNLFRTEVVSRISTLITFDCEPNFRRGRNDGAVDSDDKLMYRVG